ncbi:MAG: isoprenylcysteine carboxylmethyltransferase family protein, partial [Deltaproteobacteria bacterium]|nr:isoprenylcysteine carboxylmethyltransferase family protein [Deltaproteobacteria bacterium]
GHLFLYCFGPSRNFIFDVIPSLYSAYFIFEPLGYAFFIIGLMIAGLSMFILGQSWRIGVDEETPGPLVQVGFYKYVRHPLYTGAFLCLFGSLLIVPNFLSFLLVLCCFMGFVTEATLEEQFLLQKYPREYESYMERTGRFLPIGLFSKE